MRRDETKNGLLVNEMTLREWREHQARMGRRVLRSHAESVGFDAREIDGEFRPLATGYEATYSVEREPTIVDEVAALIMEGFKDGEKS